MYAEGKEHGYLGFAAACFSVELGDGPLVQSSLEELIQFLADAPHHHVLLSAEDAELHFLAPGLALGLGLGEGLSLGQHANKGGSIISL